MASSQKWTFMSPRRAVLKKSGRRTELRYEAAGPDSGWIVVVGGFELARCNDLASAEDRALVLVDGLDRFHRPPPGMDPTVNDGTQSSVNLEFTMAGHTADRLSLTKLLEPVLTAPDNDDVALDAAINEVAETLAASGALMVDDHGLPAASVTDEAAVIGVLGTYGHSLLHLGHVEAAAQLTELIDRIYRIGRQRRRRDARPA